MALFRDLEGRADLLHFFGRRQGAKSATFAKGDFEVRTDGNGSRDLDWGAFA